MSERTSPPRRHLRSLGRVASGMAAAVLFLVGGAAPAGAEPQRTLSIDPADDVPSSPTASGTFKGASLLVNVEKITGVDLKVSPTGPTGGEAVNQSGCEVATEGGCNTGQVSFSWDIPALAYNGPYVVEATARYCDPLLCLSPETTSATPVEFRLGADPRAPTDLKAEPGADRTVSLSWARNPEPDLLYYALFRKDPGGEFRRLGSDIKQPASGRPTFTDSSVAGTSGGDFVYMVFAVRNGFSGDDTTTKISKASGERTTTVAPPATTTTGPDGAGGPVTTVAGEGVDISSFLSGQAPTLPTPGPIFLDLPDTGFGETLPFGSLPDEAEPGEEDAVPPTPRDRQVAEFNRNRPLIPVAAGLILLVMAGHIRLLNVRTRQPAPAKPPPGTYVARALEAARAKQAQMPFPVDVTAAVANGGHHRVPPPGDDVAGLPVWAEFEPVAAIGLLDAPDPEEEFRPQGGERHRFARSGTRNGVDQREQDAPLVEADRGDDVDRAPDFDFDFDFEDAAERLSADGGPPAPGATAERLSAEAGPPAPGATVNGRHRFSSARDPEPEPDGGAPFAPEPAPIPPDGGRRRARFIRAPESVPAEAGAPMAAEAESVPADARLPLAPFVPGPASTPMEGRSLPAPEPSPTGDARPHDWSDPEPDHDWSDPEPDPEWALTDARPPLAPFAPGPAPAQDAPPASYAPASRRTPAAADPAPSAPVPELAPVTLVSAPDGDPAMPTEPPTRRAGRGARSGTRAGRAPRISRAPRIPWSEAPVPVTEAGATETAHATATAAGTETANGTETAPATGTATAPAAAREWPAGSEAPAATAPVTETTAASEATAVAEAPAPPPLPTLSPPDWEPVPEPEAEPFFEAEYEPELDPEVLYSFDVESQWSAEPEVFVSPRR